MYRFLKSSKASPGEDNLQILGLLSPEVSTHRIIIPSVLDEKFYKLLKSWFPGFFGRTSQGGRAGCGHSSRALAQPEEFPPAARLISAAN